MGLTFGEDRVCRPCKGIGRTHGILCSLCGGSGIEGREREVTPRMDLARPTPEGERLRNEGMDAVAAAEPRWMDRALAWIEHLPGGARLDADMLTGDIGRPDHENATGSAFGLASRRGLIRPVGFVQPSRPQRHAGRALEWERVR